MQLNHLLWGVLKRNGKVDMDRGDGIDAPPRWHPLFSAPKVHHVRRHKAEDEDLSFLRSDIPVAPEAPAMPDSCAASSSADEGTSLLELENTILHLVREVPEKDILFYISELPLQLQRAAPAAFKRLREAGLLEREVTPQGTYIWR